MQQRHDVSALESVAERQSVSRGRKIVAGVGLSTMAFLAGACETSQHTTTKAPVALSVPEATTSLPVATTVPEAPSTTNAVTTTTAPKVVTSPTTTPSRETPQNNMLSILQELESIQSGQQLSNVAEMDFIVQAGTHAQQDQNGHLVDVVLGNYRVAHPVIDKSDSAICFKDINSGSANCVQYTNLSASQRLIVINPADQSQHYFDPASAQDTATRTDTVINNGGRLYVQDPTAPDAADGQVLIVAGQPPID